MATFAPTSLINMMRSVSVDISSNIITDIEFYLQNTKSNHNHVSFLVDDKRRNILSYSFNFFYKSKKFPFSIHAEINSITKYYKNTNLSKLKPKTILVVLKITKTGVIGMSKPCFHCRIFLNNNFDNLNLNKIYYSNKDILEQLYINELMDKESQHLSAGFKHCSRKSN